MKILKFIITNFLLASSVMLFADTCQENCKKVSTACKDNCLKKYECTIKCFYGAGKKCQDECKLHKKACLANCPINKK